MLGWWLDDCVVRAGEALAVFLTRLTYAMRSGTLTDRFMTVDGYVHGAALNLSLFAAGPAIAGSPMSPRPSRAS
jgi:hypothetical protein